MSIFKPEFEFESVWDIEGDFFKEKNIRYLLLDIDNTLIGDNVLDPDERTLEFLDRLNRENISFFLVSNNKRERVDAFNRTLGQRALYRAGKPFARKLKKVMQEMGAVREQTALIGDQIFTDLLAAKNVGIRMILVSPINTKIENNFFKAKRVLENMVYKRRVKASEK